MTATRLNSSEFKPGKKKTTYIHVNRHRIALNLKQKTNVPVIAVRKNRRSKAVYCQLVEIAGPSRVVYDKCNPIACGSAQVWIETEAKVTMYGVEGVELAAG